MNLKILFVKFKVCFRRHKGMFKFEVVGTQTTPSIKIKKISSEVLKTPSKFRLRIIKIKPQINGKL